jgi:phage terminase small subunit
MTPKQKRFVAEYLIDLNAAAAAVRAGYSARTAKEQASRLLTNVNVAAAIDEGLKERFKHLEIKADRVLQEIARLAFFDPRELFHPDGRLKEIHEMDEDTVKAIASFESTELPEGRGTMQKFRLADKGLNLERLGKYLGLFKDKHELSGPDGAPLAPPVFKVVFE